MTIWNRKTGLNADGFPHPPAKTVFIERERLLELAESRTPHGA